jgi:hypothetical protein
MKLATAADGRSPAPVLRWAPKVIVAAAVAGAVAAAQWLGRTSGSTRAERRRRLPGDELFDRPTISTNHAVTIPAPTSPRSSPPTTSWRAAC